MNRYSHLWQKSINLWLELRHSLIAFAVFLNGLLIFNTIWGMSINLIELFHIQSFSGIDWASIANGPWFMLGMFLMLNAFGLLFRARIAWAVSIILLLITLVFTMHFYPHLSFSISFCVITLIGLLALGKDFNHSSATAGGIFAFISFTMLLFYSTYGALYFGDGFHPTIKNLMDALYFSIVTMTTVGYGDIIPMTEPARLFTVSIIIAGITVFATSLTTVFGPIIRGGLNKLVKGNQQHMKRNDHFIVCGMSILAVSTITQLKQRGLDVTMIVGRSEEEFPQIEQRIGSKCDIISGDSTDDAVLSKAGLENCRALLALTDDDAANAFIVLSAKELSPEVKTVLAVNDSKNMNRVKQVKADIVLSPQLFGSEILASVLSGEPLDNDKLISMLLTSGHGLFDKPS
ncbi:voltage-gated potassium channel protein [Shewanella sp. D64]|uniref:voltage-gated potassium channel protein n=1 Tax=unclassified Shewanella TaxID=196818 RepID=UPI0022BA2B2B|nr:MULTISPECIES: voltage-gated potassium channel protein [unclassified Shewanella]MEC4727520.1 voltage-gated potassium channel protein [Shewanella sp. D64]MEC4738071.1 voltage-gated potassium channel protein [Shewanella sp. E94]WBJ96413.1 voltage-gated potassium channel protein [Shewanella sp. MTB7]